MTIVPDEAEMKLRRDARHEHMLKMCEGKSKRYRRRMERVWRTEGFEEIKVRVVPKNEEMRAILSHPSGNLAFRETGGIEWPLDQFTLRRLRDGDVTLDSSYQHQLVKDVPQESRAARRVAAGAIRPGHDTRRVTARSGRPAPPSPQSAE